MNNLPSDFLSFIEDAEKRKFTLSKGEVQKGEFLPAEKIALKRFEVTGEEEKKEFEGFDLLQDADGYDPEGILIWFPELNAFGSYDPDHEEAIIYKETDWKKLEEDLTWFVNGQWYPQMIEHTKLTPDQKD